MKKIITILLTFLLILIPCFPVYADDSNFSVIEDTHETNNDIITFKESYCEKSPSGRHEAYARGWAKLYRGSASGSNTLVFNGGSTWQCPYCYQAILTSNDYIPDGISIGYYSTYNPGYALAQYGTILYSNNIYYTTSSTLVGVNFRYSPYFNGN